MADHICPGAKFHLLACAADCALQPLSVCCACWLLPLESSPASGKRWPLAKHCRTWFKGYRPWEVLACLHVEPLMDHPGVRGHQAIKHCRHRLRSSLVSGVAPITSPQLGQHLHCSVLLLASCPLVPSLPPSLLPCGLELPWLFHRHKTWLAVAVRLSWLALDIRHRAWLQGAFGS